MPLILYLSSWSSLSFLTCCVREKQEKNRFCGSTEQPCVVNFSLFTFKLKRKDLIVKGNHDVREPEGRSVAGVLFANE